MTDIISEDEGLATPLMSDESPVGHEDVSNRTNVHFGGGLSRFFKNLMALIWTGRCSDGTEREQSANREIRRDKERLYSVAWSDEESLIGVICSGDITKAAVGFAHAAKRDYKVYLRCENGMDVLGFALKQKNFAMTKFLLEKLAMKCKTIEETAKIIKDNVVALEKQFPHLLRNFIVKNKFSHEIGRIALPVEMFQTNGLVVKSCDLLPSRWHPHQTELRQLLNRMTPKASHTSNDGSVEKLIGVVHALVIEDSTKPEVSGIIRSLLMSNVPVDVFKSDFVEWIVDWKWNRQWKYWICMLVILNITLIACFSEFTIRDEERESDEDLLLPDIAEGISLAVSCGICLLCLVRELLSIIHNIVRYKIQGLVYSISSPWNWVRVAESLLMIAWLAPALVKDKYDSIPEVIIAIECILVWVSILYYAQSFDWTGPLVATVRMVLWDIIPFLILGMDVLMGFGLASFSLHDAGDITALPKTLEALFFALLGDFDPYSVEHDLEAETECSRQNVSSEKQPLHPEENPLAEDKLAKEVVLNVFLLFEGIILLTLLFAIMNGSYKKIKENERAELIRCRATVITDCESLLSKRSFDKQKARTKTYLFMLKPADEDCDLSEEINRQSNMMTGETPPTDLNNVNASMDRPTGTAENVDRLDSTERAGCHSECLGCTRCRASRIDSPNLLFHLVHEKEKDPVYFDTQASASLFHKSRIACEHFTVSMT